MSKVLQSIVLWPIAHFFKFRPGSQRRTDHPTTDTYNTYICPLEECRNLTFKPLPPRSLAGLKIMACQHFSFIMSTPLGVGHIIFAFSSVRRPASAVTLGFRSFQSKLFILSSTKFGMGVFWVNSLHGIAFGEDSSIVN